jgi:hypothetical protein
MEASEIKKLLTSQVGDSSTEEISMRLEAGGIAYDFSNGFTSGVLNRIFSPETKVIREIEFSRYLNIAFSRVALTGVAAIVLLLISIFLMDGSLSLNSLLGINDSYDESIVCLLTGN